MVRTMWPERCAGRLEERRLAAGPGAGGGERATAPPRGPGPAPAPPPPSTSPATPGFVSPLRRTRAGEGAGRGACRHGSGWPRGNRASFPLAVPQKAFSSPLSGPLCFPEGRDRSRGAACVPDPTHPSAILQTQFIWDSVIF